eukprot:TRINITY_DN12631_c0_g1_i1.p1 TRINITY_DN12631_c0_g1~~TRINITY_DN12631_c0_g1_i1.p1  ORF type:complete len:315 (+),score=47.41 TRINITY_DN12631_c0_g1_i1:61-945(+)
MCIRDRNRKAIEVIPLPLFKDNYSYLIQSPKKSILVDPADEAAINEHLASLTNQSPFNITHIFLTHKHWDHARDANKLRKSLEQKQKSKIEVISGHDDHIEGSTQTIKSDSAFDYEDFELKVLTSPCHTRGHLMFYIESKTQPGESNQKVIFTGDTIFIGGCGKFFEGEAKEMYLNFQKLKSLPKDTKIYCGHEYTVSNLEWSSQIEYTNPHISKKLKWAREVRSRGDFTIPSTIEEELLTNVFIRCDTPEVMKLMNIEDPIKCLANLREFRNQKKTLISVSYTHLTLPTIYSV